MEGSSTSISSWDRLLKMWFSNTLRLVEKCTWHMEQCIVTQSCQCLVVSAGCAARALSWSMHTKPQTHGKTGVWSSACEQSVGVSQAGWMFSAHFQPFLQYVRMGCRSTLKGMQWLERNLSKLTPLWAVTVLYFAVWHNCILTLHAKKKKKLDIAQVGMFGKFTYAGLQRYWMDLKVFKPLFASGIAYWFWSYLAFFY